MAKQRLRSSRVLFQSFRDFIKNYTSQDYLAEIVNFF